MRRHWSLLAVPVAALLLAGLVGALRRESVSATPGQVVEDFLGRVLSDRYEKAGPLLVDAVGGSATPASLKSWRQGAESGLGNVRRVRGETEWIAGEEAEATGILVAERRERRLRFGLERENGRWKIARLDDFWGEEDAGVAARDSIRVREGWRQRSRSVGSRLR